MAYYLRAENIFCDNEGPRSQVEWSAEDSNYTRSQVCDRQHAQRDLDRNRPWQEHLPRYEISTHGAIVKEPNVICHFVGYIFHVPAYSKVDAK
jgi:hypothetical protein